MREALENMVQGRSLLPWRGPEVSTALQHSAHRLSSESGHDILRAVGLTALMEQTEGVLGVTIGLIDGPVALDHRDIVGAPVQSIHERSMIACSQLQSAACRHGTFVVGILSARRGSAAPAICPGCQVIVRPIFAEDAGPQQTPFASPETLAEAIAECVDSGARIINLSVSTDWPSPNHQQDIKEALDYAARRGTIVVAAAGNQGVVGSSAITRHPATIPVVACDFVGRPLETSNLSGTAVMRGLAVPGVAVTSLDPSGLSVTRSGTSVAAPFVTGALALLASLLPDISLEKLKFSLIQSARRRRTGIVPPMMDAAAAYRSMAPAARTRVCQPERKIGASAMVQPEDSVEVNSPGTEGSTSLQADVVAPTAAADAANAGQPMMQGWASSTPSFIYALGTIEPRFPSPAIEKELAQVTGRSDSAGLTDQQALHTVLSERANRYVARQLSWVFTIEGQETYLLVPRDPADIELLVGAVRPNPRPTDIDVVLGVKGPIAPPEMANGLMVPILVFDQIYSFDTDTLIGAIPRPEDIEPDRFSATAEEVFYRLVQIADNAGATDGDRALNYLSVRYPDIYARAAQAHAANQSLSAVTVRTSRLALVRNIVDVVFSFTNRETDVTESYFVRVDVTEEFPFLVTKLSPYYDR